VTRERAVPLIQSLTPAHSVDHPESIESSRENAVQRVFRGASTALVGAVVMGAASFFGVSSGLPFTLGICGFVLGGLGLVGLGRATRHFVKYGTRASLVGFVATAGLGASAVFAGLSNWIGVTLGGGIWGAILHWSMNGFTASERLPFYSLSER
jgi:hypothetical protein